MDRFDDGRIFMVNPDTRKITVPVKYSSVVGDNGSQILTFSIKRYVDGYDLIDCNDVTVHYNIISEEDDSTLYSDVYQCDDLRISETDENIILVSWKLSKNATKFNGILSFTIKYSTTYVDEEGQVKETYTLQSRICEKLRIFTRVNNSQQVVEEYGDVLQQWKEDLERSKPTANVSKKGNVTTITITDKDGTTTSTILDGVDGKSAYEIAVEKGFEGSEEEWLESLKYSSSEEFQQLAEQVKQDAQTSSNKAQEAMTAATNADKYAKDAQTSKEEASASALSAIEAANNAGISASSASDSANTAKTNANKTNQDKIEVSSLISGFDDHVVEKTTEFDQNTTEKTAEFNQNVTEKTNAFDAKVVEAKSAIDEKVAEATSQAEKAKSEADRATQATDGKLDKNQGAENVGKVMVVNEEGNLVPGESSPKNIYTKEEVDDLLYDKMDKPYKPITINDGVTIEDCLDGRFKINKILGNIYQSEESNIVPTPERPVPIRSKKVKVGEEYVELRSLKETTNLFDINLAKVIGALTDSVTVESDGFVVTSTDGGMKNYTPFFKITKAGKYTFKYDFEVLDGDARTGSIGIKNITTDELFYVNNSLALNGYTIEFTAGEYSVWLYKGQGATDDSNNIVKYKNIMLVEGDSVPSSYVPPTVRDYKIVDHTTQTSKIIRNIGYEQKDFSTLKPTIQSDGRYWYSFQLKNRAVSNTNTGILFSNIAKSSTSDEDTNKFYTTAGHANFIFNNSIQDDVEFQYQLETPTEEEIAYLEDDTSEVGYSWQDSTSPSPTIPAEIKGVDKIDILKTGKNLFNIEYASSLENWINTNTDGYFYIPIKVPKGKQLCLSNDKTIASGRGYYANFSPYKDKNSENYYFFYNTTTGSAYGKFTILTKDEVIYLRVKSIANNLSLFIEDFKHLQLEVGDAATAYEPYTEQHVNITLLQPLYQDDIVNVESGDYEYEDQKYIVTGDEEFYQDYQSQSGYYGRYFYLENGNGVLTEKIWCNYLSYIPGSWSLASEGCCQNSRKQINLKFSNDRLGITDNTPVEEKRTAFANYLKQLYASETPLYVVVKVVKTTQPISPEDLAKLKSLKTEQGVTNVFVGGEVKPTIEARYPRDLALVQQQLEQKILLISDSLIDTQAKVLLQGGN